VHIRHLVIPGRHIIDSEFERIGLGVSLGGIQ